MWRLKGIRLVGACVLGAIALCAISIPNRIMLGYDLGVGFELALDPRGFVVPGAVGAVCGVALAWFVERLRASEGRYRVVADLATEMIFWRLASGELAYVSPSCLSLTGYTADEFLEDPGLLERIVHPEDRDLHANHRHALGPGGKAGRVDFRIVRRDGEVRWVSHRCRPVRGPDGPRGVRGSHVDVTEQRATEAHLRHALRNDALGRIAESVAHDFNSAVTAIAASAEHLALTAPDDRTRRSADDVVQAAFAATRLTRSLLTFARREQAAPATLALQEVARDFERMLRRVAGPRVRLTLEADGAPLAVRADASQLQQVLVTLASNARDAMPDGGSLTIRFERVRVAEVPPLWAAPGGSAAPGWHAVLVVSDTGVGMDQRTREHLFEPFFTTKAVGHGTGLGLAVVEGIVRDHGGFVTVESAPGQGATFRVHLPDAMGNALQTPPPELRDEPTSRSA